MSSQWIEIPGASEPGFTGYLALPPDGKGPGIVLVQEIWGVNDHIRAVADMYALAGYVVLAPDIFWRMHPRVDLQYDEAGSKEAYAYYQRVDTGLAAQDVALAVDFLRRRAERTGKLATLGYCLGGQLAFRGAALGEADAAVCFYGGGIDQHLDLAPTYDRPVLFHYAAEDAHIGQDKVNAVKAAFAHKPEATFIDYPGVGHGFNCWGRKAVFNQRAASLAAGITLQFLAEHIGVA